MEAAKRLLAIVLLTHVQIILPPFVALTRCCHGIMIGAPQVGIHCTALDQSDFVNFVECNCYPLLINARGNQR